MVVVLVLVKRGEAAVAEEEKEKEIEEVAVDLQWMVLHLILLLGQVVHMDHQIVV